MGVYDPVLTHYSYYANDFSTCKCYYMQIYGDLLGFYVVLLRVLPMGVITENTNSLTNWLR